MISANEMRAMRIGGNSSRRSAQHAEHWRRFSHVEAMR